MKKYTFFDAETTLFCRLFTAKMWLVAGLFTIVLLVSGCKKFLEVPPPKDKLVSSAVFSDDNSATSAMVGIYSDMMQLPKFISLNITLFGGLSADELGYPSASNPVWTQFANNSIIPDNTDLAACWSQAYKYIYDANICMEGLSASTGVTPAVKAQLLGEAKFIRAFNYFYLVNLFGDVPMPVASDYAVNADLARTKSSDVYDQIIRDLKDAQQLLSSAYVTNERVRPNKWTATALLSRSYLYTGDWVNAAAQATAVIESGTYSLAPLNSVFLKSSNETIWQIMPVNASYNTIVGFRLIATSSTSRPLVTLTNNLVNSFEQGDQRKVNWVGTSVASGVTYYSFSKYKIKSGSSPFNEYFIALRLGEQYFIRAEARAKQNDLDGARGDLKMIRDRAGLPPLSASLNQAMILDAIEKERRVELFGEWGDRWLDIKRTGRIDVVMNTFKPGIWRPSAALWPVPLTQLNANPKLVQNPGYN